MPPSQSGSIFPLSLDSNEAKALHSRHFFMILIYISMISQTAAQTAYNKAYGLLINGRLAKSETLCDSLLLQAPTNQKLLFLKGQIKMAQNCHQETIFLMNSILKTMPKHIDAHILKGKAYQELNRIKEAAEAYERAIVLSPGRKDLITKLALINYNRHAYRAASTLIRPLLDHETATPYQFAVYCNALIKMGRFNETISWSKKALQRDSSNFTNNLNLGLAYYEKNNMDSAMTWLQHAVDQNPYSDKAHYYLAEAMAKKKWASAAITHHEESVSIAGVYKWKSMKMLVKYYYNQQDYQSCLYNANLYLDHEPQDSFVHHFMGRALADGGSIAEADTSFHNAIMYGGQDFLMMTYFYRALNAFQDKKYAKAIKYYKTVISLDSKFAYAYYNLAITYDDYYKDKRPAIHQYQQFLNLADPEKTEPSLLKSAKERLSSLKEATFFQKN